MLIPGLIPLIHPHGVARVIGVPLGTFGVFWVIVLFLTCSSWVSFQGLSQQCRGSVAKQSEVAL